MKLKDEMFSIVAAADDRLQLRLNADHPIYQVHFPGNPITPGVCIVQIICELLQERFGKRLTLDKIVNMKFTAPLSPVEAPRIVVEWSAISATDTNVTARGTISTEAGQATKFSLVFGVVSE